MIPITSTEIKRSCRTMNRMLKSKVSFRMPIHSLSKLFHIFLLTGSYSKKEKEKWLHPVALDNNPYSKENLDRRLKKNNSLGNGNA